MALSIFKKEVLIMQDNTNYQAGLYLRLSKDDMQQGESTSIGTQRDMLTDFCNKHNFAIAKIYVDDGYSGTNFNRPGFQELLDDVDNGIVNLVITKDLSRLGRDYIMTGYYSEIYFPDRGVRYIAVADNFDSLSDSNDIAPFRNILNDMYARDLSRKIKNAKHQQAKSGLSVATQTPYGYCKDPNNKKHMIVDPETAKIVKLIFDLAQDGMGGIAIAKELEKRQIVTPAVSKYLRGDLRFSEYPAVKSGKHYQWRGVTVNHILTDLVYTGTLVSLKTEVINCKTKQHVSVPKERQIITPNAHEAIVTQEQFDAVQEIRSHHVCFANTRRFNLFRGKLFCECCGHPLIISKKQLKYYTTDIYLCMHHNHRPDVCPQTHRIYHDMLCKYVLQQIRSFAKSMRSKKINTPIAEYVDIQELTPEILDAVIERIEIGHVTNKSKLGKVITIYWKLHHEPKRSQLKIPLK